MPWTCTISIARAESITGSNGSTRRCCCSAFAATGSILPPVSGELYDQVAAHGKDVEYYELDSPDGHDAFLKEWGMLTDSIGPFIASSLNELEVAPARASGVGH